MASLSEEMKSKRDVKRKSEILIIDRDLGNFGLYKAILSMEYVLECAYNTEIAKHMCRGRRFDVIVSDGQLGAESVKEFYEECKATYGDMAPELLVMEEPDNKESIIRYLCIGAKGYIPKPFSKEGMANAIYNVLQKRRKNERKHSILLVDNDFNGLKAMKSVLAKKYIVNIINDRDIARDFVLQKHPDLIVLDVSILGGENCICEAVLSDENIKSRILFIADALDTDIIGRCSRFQPEGILMKPVTEDVLTETIGKIFLRQSYVDDFDKR